MKLKPEEFKAKTSEILASLTDQAKVSTLLAELAEHNDDAVTEVTTAKTTAEKLTADNEKLRQANLDLSLKIGSTQTQTKENKPVDNTPKFEQLFDEQGNLK